MLFYTDVPVCWWQMYKLGLKGNELLVYAYIFDMSYNHPEEFGVDDVDLIAKFNLTVEEVRTAIQSLLDKKLIHCYDDAYYAPSLPDDVRKAIRRVNKIQ